MSRKDKIPVAAVVGPTASGKSRLAVELALRRNGEVISADSMQIYKGMNIGTAKPTTEEMRGVPHHLIDFAPLSQPFSVADYVSLASDCISEVYARGRLPVIAGGTGLYIRSLLQNIRFTEDDKDEALRKELAEKAEKLGVQTLIDDLRSFDPASAQRIHPNNLGRVIRAIEIYRTTGVTMTEQLKLSRQTPSPYDTCIIGLDFQDRQKLYDRINLRVDRMIQDGLLAEAEEILNRPGAQTALQAIGYKELLPYFRSECSLDEAVESIKRESRRYAKRQLTWFRRDENIRWIMVDEYEDFDGVIQQAFRIIGRKGWE
ncbi:tRNA (adenosine(37)-N6)-dimethylallyltransferase MiaA [Caproiciproducens sp. CPB-2]|uniref:tRNA (adenosine(37)-N6)-dimethylallyltransferase MiaA n=1 Tax=Caproiciproducens sp. CPB-2 TaxID=3030017 RepID=UPI0023DC388C|nr:tRNA (adenosine(37)-N6)-dimethylallyltransferase MiaA [Caproiciproducens sp. CPB-2]MDF1495743.1 tRNA (adenosine(37)-N6)-dimethylallyltransferase MiaA [Caproiciproducens sp. CPB-2]